MGNYGAFSFRLPEQQRKQVGNAIRIALKADHTAEFSSVPEFDGFGIQKKCELSGTANWELDDTINNGWGWSVAFEHYHAAKKNAAGECNWENSTWGILILSRHPPYRLYDIVGDPDSDTGIEFKRMDR